MFPPHTTESISSRQPSAVPGGGGRAPGVVLLTQYYYICRVLGIQSKKQILITTNINSTYWKKQVYSAQKEVQGMR